MGEKHLKMLMPSKGFLPICTRVQRTDSSNPLKKSIALRDTATDWGASFSSGGY
jgi:hypothetical protein